MYNVRNIFYLLLALLAIWAVFIKKVFGGAMEKAFDLIKQLEGRDGYNGNGTYKAVGDVGGVATIGYGSTVYPNGSPVKYGDTCTESEAITYMQAEASNYYRQITGAAKVKLSDSQAAALTSFAYNVGIGGLFGSTLWAYLQTGKDKQTVAAEFDKWVHVNGEYVQGLYNRRQAEKQMFLA